MDLERDAGSMDSSTVQATEGSSPHHQVVLKSSLDLRKNLEFDQIYRYVSALPAKLVGSYGTADALLAWHPTPHITFTFVAQNLLQPHHPEFNGDPGSLVGIRRSVYAKRTWRSTPD